MLQRSRAMTYAVSATASPTASRVTAHGCVLLLLEFRQRHVPAEEIRAIAKFLSKEGDPLPAVTSGTSRAHRIGIGTANALERFRYDELPSSSLVCTAKWRGTGRNLPRV